MRRLLQVLLLASALAAVSANIQISGRPSISGHTITYSSCSIKNKRFGTYFYAAGANYKKGDNRRVFLWRPGNDIRENNWSLISNDRGATWKIKNNYWGAYLYASSSKYNSDRREVYTHPGTDDQSLWRLDSHDNGRFVTIVNYRYPEYMYADGAKTWDSQRRRVFTWTPGTPAGIMWEESQWEINC